MAGPKKRARNERFQLLKTIYRFVVRHIAQRSAEALDACESWNDSGYLFVSPTGAPLHERNISEAFHLASDHAGVPRTRFHASSRNCSQHTAAPSARS
jgi:hypothetical protein